MYYVYILKSLKDNTLYKGFTSDLSKRCAEHNSGKSNFTSTKTPWILVYFEIYSQKDIAIKREKYLKSAAGRRFIKTLDLFHEINPTFNRSSPLPE
jgi:putative endonuclease